MRRQSMVIVLDLGDIRVTVKVPTSVIVAVIYLMF
jgi:hypothetical protein